GGERWHGRGGCDEDRQHLRRGGARARDAGRGGAGRETGRNQALQVRAGDSDRAGGRHRHVGQRGRGAPHRQGGRRLRVAWPRVRRDVLVQIHQGRPIHLLLRAPSAHDRNGGREVTPTSNHTHIHRL